MKYESVIGLEIHAELSTKTKIFCGCSTEFGGEENTHCCPVCTGMPGVLPVLNKRVVEYCMKAGLATNCSITPYGKQDRKNYFYPDLPKAYQISQFDLPVSVGGHIDIMVDGKERRIGITRIHIEEDAGKLVHDAYAAGTRVDYNRCGVPLIEIVTEPDLRSPEEAKIFLDALKNILLYTEVSDCKMQEGSLRCDVNVSLRPEGSTEFGTRTEMKNVNSFGAAYRAMCYEIKRQTEVLEAGGVIEQETRKWDDVKGMSVVLRSKEDAQDYRYFPDPDLMPIVISDEWVEEIRASLPELPLQKKARYMSDFNLSDYDATVITGSKKLAEFFDECVSCGSDPKAVCNWLMGDLTKLLNDKDMEPEDIPFPASHMANLISLIDKGTISGSIAKKVLSLMFEDSDAPEKIVEKHGMVQVSDEGAIRAMIEEVLAANEKSVNDYKSGKTNAMGFLVGQTMRASKGKANPQMINKLLKEMLDALCE